MKIITRNEPLKIFEHKCSCCHCDSRLLVEGTDLWLKSKQITDYRGDPYTETSAHFRCPVCQTVQQLLGADDKLSYALKNILPKTERTYPPGMRPDATDWAYGDDETKS